MAERDFWVPLIGIAIVIALAFLLSGCTTTRYVTAESIRTDTLYTSKIYRDSIYVKDSVSVMIKNDTVWKDRWHTEVVDKSRIDTIRETKTDSIFVEKEVEKELTLGQKISIKAGTIVLPLCTFTFIIYIIVKKFF